MSPSYGKRKRTKRPSGKSTKKYSTKLVRAAPRRSTGTVTVPGSVHFVPDRLKMHLTYCANKTVGTGILGVYAQKWNMNSIYDPDRTGGGHQPMGRDQLAVLYNRYIVTGCSYQCVWQPNGAGMFALTARVGNDEDNNPDIDTERENAYTKTAFVHHVATAIGSIPNVKLSGKYALEKIYGVSRTKMLSDDLYGATMSNSPSEYAILHTTVWNADGALTNAYGSISVKLVYSVECFDRKDLSAS